MNIFKKLTSTTCLSLAGIGALIACGSNYAPRLLNYKYTIFKNQSSGIDLMFPNNDIESNAHTHFGNLPLRLKATYEADIADLKLAAPELPQEVITAYSTTRHDMLITAWNQPADKLMDLPKNWLNEEILAAIPKEFSIYLQAAVNYRKGLTEDARKQWKTLLLLPANERKYKTIWASWMLARTSTADGEAMQWYDKVKEYKKTGFPDSLNVTERDWTSFFTLKSADYLTALDIYINEGKEKITDPISASYNIYETFWQAISKYQDSPEIALQLFSKKQDHALALSYYLSRISASINHLGFIDNDPKEDHLLKQWVKILCDPEKELPFNKDKILGICASTAYGIDDEETLNRCLTNMKQPTTESLWLQAKLATYQGKLNLASSYYEQAVQSIHSKPKTDEAYFYLDGYYPETGQTAHSRHFDIYSEFASVELGRKRYQQALDHFLTAGNYADAAYIAETLLSPLELLAHVRNSAISSKSEFITNLLTRKLMRHEYFKDAQDFALDEHIKSYNEYIKHYRVAINKSHSIEARVQGFITAAIIIINEGNELFYLEDRSRPFLRISAAGRTMHKKYDQSEYRQTPLPSAAEFTPKITLDELNRIKQNYTRISPVYMKKTLAADLLYRAAHLLPKNDSQAAKLLWQAGDWTRADPKIADKYYQALIKRCLNTKLGKACDERRWFLKADELIDL